MLSTFGALIPHRIEAHMTIKEFTITVAVILSLVFYGAIIYKGCRKPTVPPDAIKLLPNETDKITVTPTTIVVTSRSGIKTTPNYHHGGTITRTVDGTVKYRSKDLGSSKDLGLSTDFRSIGAGIEFLYYKDFSLLGGSHFINMKRGELQLHLYAGVGYRLPIAKFNNVSVFAAFDTDRKVIGGLFLRFGNS